MKQGRDIADAAVVQKLYARAMGYSLPAEKVFLFRVPAMPVRTLEELLDDPHLKATGFFTEREHPTEGPELDDVAGDGAGLELGVGLVDLVESDAARDHEVELREAAHVEVDEARMSVRKRFEPIAQPRMRFSPKMSSHGAGATAQIYKRYIITN